MNETEATTKQTWIVSPWFDLCFFANLWWLAALLPVPESVGVTQTTPVEFWQIYFLTTPHRWLTLLLVTTDPDRREGRERLFIGIALMAAAAVVGVWTAVGSLTCLILVDFVWNAWHFASQHGGILRIYGRKAGGGRPTLERYAFRTFITYTALRTAGWITGWTEGVPWARAAVSSLDLAVFILPACLILLELFDRLWLRPGKSMYMLSVIAMYTSLLLAIRGGDHFRVTTLVVASAAFHSVEYMAIVTYYAWQRRTTGSDAPFRTMATNWLRVLSFYVVLTGLVTHVVYQKWQEVYTASNLWAAYLHYAYDGMIWKLRRPATARSLAAEAPELSPSKQKG